MTEAEAIDLVQRYLAASEARRLDEAQRFLAPGAVLVFPSGRYTSVAEMAAAASGRYRWVKKTYVEWDVASRPDGTMIVITTGMLYGENLHGVPFQDVRYIDRFVIHGGRILSQHIWNDLDASGVLDRRG